MDIKTIVITVIIGVASGYIGASLHGKRNGTEVSKILIKDVKSKNSIFLGFDNGIAKLEFRNSMNNAVCVLGVEQKNSYLHLERDDGSLVSISPNDECEGYNLMMLKSKGEGKGVFMSMLTSDDLMIYQSRIGSLELGGSTLDNFGLEIRGKDGKTVLAKLPKY